MKFDTHFYYDGDFLWFRLFGYGLSFKNTKTAPLLYSERMGYRRVKLAFGWSVGILTPSR